MWNTCEQRPQTKGQSSPGILQSGQQPSNAIRQIPQLSSLATQRHVATPIHSDVEQQTCGDHEKKRFKLEVASSNKDNIQPRKARKLL